MVDPISIGIMAVGTGLQFLGASKAKKNQKAIAELDRQRMEVKKEQMRLDALTSTRDVVRQAQLQSAIAANRGANSGGGLDSSGIQGALGQAESGAALKIGLIDQQLSFAERTGDLNTQISDRQAKTSDYQMLTSIGSSLSSNSRTIGKMFGEDGQSSSTLGG